jgi:ubiquinone/menaquinone biosynthesis C-methylase UbiE
MPVRNPWLDIPEEDYVAHMTSQEVDQYRVLNRLLREGLATARPEAALVLGCSSGNGLEHVDPTVTSRVVAVDINPGYLQQLALRFPNPAFDLHLRCADLESCDWEPAAFDFVHAALVFEYLDWSPLLSRIASALRQGGMLTVVLQCPSAEKPAITPTRFTTLRSLESIFRFVDPEAVVAETATLGLDVKSRRTELLDSGKAFEVLQLLRRSAE